MGEKPKKPYKEPIQTHIDHCEFMSYNLVQLSDKKFEEKVNQFKTGELLQKNHLLDGIREIRGKEEQKFQVLVIDKHLYYPESLEEIIEENSKMEKFYLQFLLKYNLEPKDRLDERLSQELSQSCNIRKGVIDIIDENHEEIEVWVCDDHKKLYFRKKYEPYVKARIEDVRNIGYEIISVE